MAVYQVASTADYNTLMGGGITSSDTVEFLDAGTFADIHIGDDGAVTHAAVPVGATFVAETSGVPTLERLIINAGGVSVQGLKVQVAHDYFTSTNYNQGAFNPALPTTDWHLVEINNLSDYQGLELLDLHVRGGYYNAGSFDAFETTAGTTEAAYASLIGELPGTYTGDPFPADNSTNGMTYAPGGIGPGFGGGTRPQGNLTVRGCLLEDLANGIEQRPAMSSGQTLLLQRNRFVRTYVDTINLSQPNDTFAGPAWIEISGNEFEDCVWCQPQDNNNPHGEPLQIGASSGSLSRLKGLFLAGNMSWFTPGFRGGGQRFFMSDHNYGYPYEAPYIIDNLILSRRSTKGIWIEADSPNKTGAIYAYVWRNAPLANPTQQAIVGNAQYEHPSTGVDADTGAAGAAAMTITWDNNFAGKNFLADNIVESVASGSHIDTSTRTNLVVGAAAVGNTYSTTYDTPAPGWDGLDTAAKTLTAYTPKTAYAAKGPIRSGDTVSTFLDRWSGATKNWDLLPSYVGIAGLLRQEPATLVTSDWGYIHAPSGSGATLSGTRSITPGTGLGWRQADDTSGTNATSWSTSAGTVTHGKYLQLRGTSDADPSQTIAFTYVIGSDTLTWSVQSESNVAYPRAVFDGTQIVRKTTAAWAASTSDKFTVAVRWKMATKGTDSNFIGANPSGTGRLQVIMRGTTKKVTISMTGTGSSTAIFSKDFTITGGCDDNNEHSILLSVDLSEALAADGMISYVDDIADVTAPGTWTSPGPFGFANGSMAPQAGGTGASTANFVGEFALFWCHTGVALDLTSADVRAAFEAAYVGPLGEGPMNGTAPDYFLPGVAANFESGDANISAANVWNKAVGSNAITAGNSEVWPPVLQLNAEVLTVGPYYVGVPIDILVTAAGYPKSVNLTTASDKTGTWDDNTQNMPLGSNGVTFSYTPTGDAGTTHTISVTNDGGYTNPSNLAISVEAGAGGGGNRLGRLGLGLTLSL